MSSIILCNIELLKLSCYFQAAKKKDYFQTDSLNTAGQIVPPPNSRHWLFGQTHSNVLSDSMPNCDRKKF